MINEIAVENKNSANQICVVKIVLVGAVISSTPGRLFSLARRLKTWLRSSMSQILFNSPALLSTYTTYVDNLSIVGVANDFVENKPNRFNQFGKFITNIDL